MKKIGFVLVPTLLCIVASPAYSKHVYHANTRYLTGDWHGKRTDWAEQGIKLDAMLFTDSAYLVNGGRNSGAKPETSAHFNVGGGLDLEKLVGWKGVQMRATVAARQGQSMGVRDLQDPSAPQLSNSQVTFGRGNQNTRLSEFSIEKQFDLGVNIKGGWMSMGSDFDVMSCNFQNSAFCGAQMGKWQSNIWMNNPVAQWGARVKYDFNASWMAQIGVYEFDSDYGQSNNESHAWRLSTEHADGVTIPIEIIWHPKSFIHGLPGSYRFGAMYNTANDPQNQKNIETGAPENHTSGEWIAIEQQLTSTGDQGQGLQMFENFTWHDRQTNKIADTEQIGLEYIGMGENHAEDMIGLAFNREHLNHRFIKGQVANGKHQFDAESEYNLELNYNCHVAKWLLVRPDLQYIVHPGASHKVGNALVLGLSSQVIF